MERMEAVIGFDDDVLAGGGARITTALRAQSNKGTPARFADS